MDPLTPEDVEHIAQLAYIKLSDEESEKMRIQLTNILGQFQALAAVDTEGVEPTGHTTDANTVMRRDEPHPPLDRELVLQNAPDSDGEFVRVRPVLE
ncbi:MAG: Asp-tRNA(Asn)/Glu-tRNA(Gln) amidotransferase subunit GatC [Chloroflexi bacterium]|nr:Asp-tRNA(Asn)/Glu-tRNA(Gln) amidotransferase subunit GatC [Chloroflexota bacterium]MCI0803996.1 Asp-tRNA(Asn)/Glu-tRNA(Gln) amidotransferase subunit GatC [Chloroflexota bacterium]MCI0808827.1 Asp-tRNA(Asn)/Glu-tRNA(Gln) amidotransferase subunit GatC [Chloroflexota bacterium]MCI0833260.1 Asp-tRNA(Asn)/Glu-tRNA(Gln) amidotransferase subunit GatC [Chloroflexota bacterium]MCI0836870.1 Asp-tRNA(Asn)/Glu-tRNA(Gln) amidotransferase subunit GatC [Chloroflexota bacterium]